MARNPNSSLYSRVGRRGNRLRCTLHTFVSRSLALCLLGKCNDIQNRKANGKERRTLCISQLLLRILDTGVHTQDTFLQRWSCQQDIQQCTGNRKVLANRCLRHIRCSIDQSCSPYKGNYIPYKDHREQHDTILRCTPYRTYPCRST